MTLQKALNSPLWKSHEIGDKQTMDNKPDIWEITYYPMFGDYKQEVWEEFDEPRALIERPMKNGIDFRTMPLRYLNRKETE